MQKASAAAEEILVVDLDLDALDTQRTHWPFFRDRRIDAYDGINQRFLEADNV
jgi:N-carbamoylputrescine amidase